MVFHVYILKSVDHNRRYIGSTDDLQKRLDIHNKDKARSSKGYRPYVIVYTEEFQTRSEAYKKGNVL
jgi:putative endonuclease